MAGGGVPPAAEASSGEIPTSSDPLGIDGEPHAEPTTEQSAPRPLELEQRPTAGAASGEASGFVKYTLEEWDIWKSGKWECYQASLHTSAEEKKKEEEAEARRIERHMIYSAS